MDGAVRRADAGKAEDDTDAGDDEDAGDTPIQACFPNPNDDGTCPEICPERCDGEDNDCDGDTDEQEAAESCELPRAMAGCVEAVCVVLGCEGLYGDCDDDPVNGCERLLDSDDNCGGCGERCGELDHAAEVGCLQGVCSPLVCEPGFDSCDGEPGNGCEATLNTLEHCGGCHIECTGSSCAGGICSQLDCGDGLADCDGDVGNGCEVSLSSVTDCGACGNACATANATAVCNEGECEFVQCKPGFDDCDGNKANGCETSLSTLSDCGECEKVCTVQGGEPSCAGGICTAASCADGFADCDSEIGNGCETSLRTLDDCGVCGQPCGPYPNLEVTCDEGFCDVLDCEQGYEDCDDDPLTGCESMLKDSQNCGECGTPCGYTNANASCSTGQCEFIACSAGWGDCDTDLADGCEIPLTTKSDCGICGRSCAASTESTIVSCTDGDCLETPCPSNTGNCDGDESNGCETSLTSDNNCGSCGNRCTLGMGCCSSGSCFWGC